MIKEVSVVVPVFNAKDTLDQLIVQLKENLTKIHQNYEIILVDDFSKDDSWEIIKKIIKNNPKIKAIKLAKNYGVDTAIIAGLDISSGKYNFIISCDLQDPINNINLLYKKIKEENFDVVCAFYKNKHPESLIEKIFSRLYWKIFSIFTDSNYPNQEGLYRVITEDAKSFFLKNQNKIKHIKVMHSTGIKKGYVNMDQIPRTKGKSGYNLKKKLVFAVDYLSTYSFKPLLYSAFLGFIISMFSFLLGAIFFSLKIIGFIDAPGWTSIMVIISFFFSILFLNLSVISIYLSKNIEESKKAATYFVSERIKNE